MSLPLLPSIENRLFLKREAMKSVLSQGGRSEPDHECQTGTGL